MKNKKNSEDFKLLRFFVYAMGTVLMLGMFCLTYIIYSHHYSTIRETKEENISNPITKKCLPKFLVSEIISEIVSITSFENNLIFLTRPSNGFQEMIIYDYCEGKILSREKLQIKNDIPVVKVN